MAGKKEKKIGKKVWDEFNRRSDDFLLSSLRERDPEITVTSMDDWEIQHTVPAIFERFDSQPPHLMGARGEPCPIFAERPHNRDARIFQLVKKDPLWLYDSCVAHRVFMAKRYRDREFFKELSKCIEETIAPKFQSRDGYVNLRNFLHRLDDSGIVILSNVDKPKIGDAYEIVKKLVNDPTWLPLRDLRLFSDKKEFRKKCKEWFRRRNDCSKILPYAD